MVARSCPADSQSDARIESPREAVIAIPVQNRLTLDSEVGLLSDVAACIKFQSDSVIVINMKHRIIAHSQLAPLNPVTELTVRNVHRYDSASTGLWLAVNPQVDNTDWQEAIAVINETLTKDPCGICTALSVEIEVYLADDSAQLIIVKLVPGNIGALVSTLKTNFKAAPIDCLCERRI